MWHRVTFKFNIYFSIDDQHEQTDEAIAWLKESGLGFKCRQYNGFGLRLWRQGRTFFYFENEADALYFVLRFNGAFKDTEVTLG